MKFCNTCAGYPCCDFCIYFEFNGQDATIRGKHYKNAVYVGKGYCRKHDMCSDPGSGCDDFKCQRLTSDN